MIKQPPIKKPRRIRAGTVRSALIVLVRAPGGEVLELRLELELGERVDLFRHVDVVGVRDIALVRS